MKLRDRVAHWIANTALRLIATKRYRDMIGGSIRYGLTAAAEDADAQLAMQRQLVAMTENDYAEANCEAAQVHADTDRG